MLQKGALNKKVDSDGSRYTGKNLATEDQNGPFNSPANLDMITDKGTLSTCTPFTTDLNMGIDFPAPDNLFVSIV